MKHAAFRAISSEIRHRARDACQMQSFHYGRALLICAPSIAYGNRLQVFRRVTDDLPADLEVSQIKEAARCIDLAAQYRRSGLPRLARDTIARARSIRIARTSF